MKGGPAVAGSPSRCVGPKNSATICPDSPFPFVAIKKRQGTRYGHETLQTHFRTDRRTSQSFDLERFRSDHLERYDTCLYQLWIHSRQPIVTSEPASRDASGVRAFISRRQIGNRQSGERRIVLAAHNDMHHSFFGRFSSSPSMRRSTMRTRTIWAAAPPLHFVSYCIHPSNSIAWIKR